MVVRTTSKLVTDISDPELPDDNPFSAFAQLVRFPGALVQPDDVSTFEEVRRLSAEMNAHE